MNNPPSPPFSHRPKRASGPEGKEGLGGFENWFIESMKIPKAKVFLLILFTILIYHPVMLGLFHAWQKNHYYNHGFLIPLISCYLVYRNREKLKGMSWKPSLYGIAFILLGILIFFLDKYFLNVLFLSSIGMLIFIMGGILFVFGKEYLRALLFPISFLLFMIPVPDFIFDLMIGPLQLTASMIGKIILRILGVPVLRDGIYLHLVSFSVEVDKSCSSMHSLIALSALSFVIAYLMMDSMGERIMIVASSIPLAIIANGFRLVLIIMLALWKGEMIFKSFFHPLSGKLFFLLALFILVLEAELIKRVHRSLATVFSNGRLFRSEKSKPR
jgi:exosortase